MRSWHERAIAQCAVKKDPQFEQKLRALMFRADELMRLCNGCKAIVGVVIGPEDWVRLYEHFKVGPDRLLQSPTSQDALDAVSRLIGYPVSIKESPGMELLVSPEFAVASLMRPIEEKGGG